MKKKGLTNHPGFLGLMSDGIIAIHADWPAYPMKIGYKNALLTLGQFPEGTVFHQIDDIDRCLLLFVGDPTKVTDPTSDNYLQVAIWHEDLLDLEENGCATGIVGLTEYEWELERYEAIRPYLVIRDGKPHSCAMLNGKLHFFHNPPPEEEDYEDSIYFAKISNSGLQLTDKGYKVLSESLYEHREEIDNDIVALISPLIQIGKYDSAVRDTCILIERELKMLTQLNSQGFQLINKFIGDLLKSDDYISAGLKTFKVELKAAFKFIRNDYAHNLIEINEDQCYATILRLSAIYSALKSFRDSTSTVE